MLFDRGLEARCRPIRCQDVPKRSIESSGQSSSEGRKHTAAARLRASIEQRLQKMIRANPMRIDYAEKLQELIDRYNSGVANIEAFFEELKGLARSLNEEE